MSVSLIAIASALGGTAYAAKVYTGKNVRDSTLTGADFKNASLPRADFQVTARGLTGARGAAGPNGAAGAPGDKGPVGNAGAAGAKGERGDDALSQYSIDYRDNARLNTPALPNSGLKNWYRQNGTIGVGQSTTVVALGRSPLASTTQQLQLSSSSNTSDPITVLAESNILVIANIELWHLADLGDDLEDEADDDNRHTRAECQASISSPNGASPFTPIGTPVYVSSDKSQQIKNITVTAGKRLQAGSYTARITCRSVDEYTNDATGYHGWEFTGGNLVVLAARH